MSVKIKERKCLEQCGDQSNPYYIINLEKYAKTDTMIITLEGKQVTPDNFARLLGYPMFTNEFYLLYKWRQEELARQNNNENYSLEFVVEYEERNLEEELKEVNTIKGIKNSLVSLEKFNDLIKKRKSFCQVFNLELNAFVVFGRLILDTDGNVKRIFKDFQDVKINDVVLKEEFNKKYLPYEVGIGFGIPDENEKCFCCCKNWTIDDLRNGSTYIFLSGKSYHIKCWKEFRKKQEIEKYRSLFNLVYGKEINFDIIENEVYRSSYIQEIPWFIFHTPDGDIKIGSQKYDILIEWLDNYKDFIGKIEENSIFENKRVINVFTIEEAFNYLMKAKSGIVK